MTAVSIARPALALSLDDRRRGACPALSAPMMTRDGLLARIALTDAISPTQLADICRLASRLGNGMLDISARGNLQVRGLTHTSAPALAAEVQALDLPLREGLAVEEPPLSKLDPTQVGDPHPLAEAIRERARSIVGLAPKMCVVVDGHGQLRLSDLLADIRLVAVTATDWRLLLGGTEKSGRVLATMTAPEAVDTVLDLLQRLAAQGPQARGRDLARDLPAQDASLMPTSPFGIFALSQGLFATGIGPAFGQAGADALIALCDRAEGLGISRVQPALDHALLFFGTQEACLALQEIATLGGFVTAARDPRNQIAACAGSPACASATIATHAIAQRAARECAPLLDGSFKLHVSGCPKGCAHPQATGLALCGSTDGVLLVAEGKAADAPFASIPFADTNATLRRLSDLVGSEQRAGETASACLARLGSTRLAGATGQS
jgi:precorrin-3B synthase